MRRPAETHEYRFLHGGVPVHSRMEMVDEFQTDPNVFIFLISTLTGGVGLNLTAANKVVIFDPRLAPARRPLGTSALTSLSSCAAGTLRMSEDPLRHGSSLLSLTALLCLSAACRPWSAAALSRLIPFLPPLTLHNL